MKYEIDKEHIKTILRNVGMAIFIGSLFYAAIDEGDLKTAIPLCIAGISFALAGSIREKT
jgi:hypothetical protein